MSFLAVTTFIIGCFSIMYYLYLIIFGGGAGFTVFWIILSIMSFIMFALFKNYDGFKEHVPKAVKYPVFLVGIIMLTLFIILEFFIIKDSLKKESYEATDYVLILGAGVRGTSLSLTLYHRLETAYEYLNKNTESKAILSGGQGPGEDISEAEAMKRYLIGKGIDEDRLIMEDQSTSTQENIKNSFEIMDDLSKDSTVTIVTSNFHQYRAKKIAEQQGKEVQGIPSKTFPPLLINYYVREFFAVVKDIVL